MSDRRQENWSLGGAAAVGVGLAAVAGLGYALYKSNQDETSPVKAVMDSFFRKENSKSPITPSPNRQKSMELPKHHNRTKRRGDGTMMCEVCEQMIGDGDLLVLPCSHMYHKECLSSNYVLQMVSGKSFVCPVNACRMIIPESIIETLE